MRSDPLANFANRLVWIEEVFRNVEPFVSALGEFGRRILSQAMRDGELHNSTPPPEARFDDDADDDFDDD